MSDDHKLGTWDTEKNWRRMKEDQRAIREGKKKYVPKLYKDTPQGGSGAGKGDQYRAVDKERYDLNYDLAFGKITKEEHAKRMAELDDNSME
tara:strand:+ start:240 stop:515 length:276 start_codon:yes stop_codon:yes gene_type:complete